MALYRFSKSAELRSSIAFNFLCSIDATRLIVIQRDYYEQKDQHPFLETDNHYLHSHL